MNLSSQNVLQSLGLATVVVLAYNPFMVLLLLAHPRIRARWRAEQPARVELAGRDPVAICQWLTEILGPVGFKLLGTPGGPCTLEPSRFRRRLEAAKIISIVFPGGNRAIVTGQARYLAKLTKDRRVELVAEGAIPFWPWFRKLVTKLLGWCSLFLFVSIFLVWIWFN